MLGDRDVLARRAREALDQEARQGRGSAGQDSAGRGMARQDSARLGSATQGERDYPLAPLASRKAPDAPDEDYVDLSLNRAQRDRLDAVAATLLELPEDRAIAAAAYEIAGIVSRWDVAWRVKSGVRTLRWLR